MCWNEDFLIQKNVGKLLYTILYEKFIYIGYVYLRILTTIKCVFQPSITYDKMKTILHKRAYIIIWHVM